MVVNPTTAATLGQPWLAKAVAAAPTRAALRLAAAALRLAAPPASSEPLAVVLVEPAALAAVALALALAAARRASSAPDSAVRASRTPTARRPSKRI
jgi:hypothetical protein